MKLRVARHTTNLQPLINFYQQLLDLQVLGNFEDHSGYDGVFLGLPEASWHLEFTVSAEVPQHRPDEDDLLVFYPEDAVRYDHLIARFAAHHIQPVKPLNPYWAQNGQTYTDPDGYRVVIVKPRG